MPHYRDGTEAKVGDRVRGTGYNAARCGYDPKAGVEGIVTEVRPGDAKAGACTLTIAFLKVPCPGVVVHGPAYCYRDLRLVVEVEYGDTVGFEKVG